MRKHVQVCCSFQPQEERPNAAVTLDLMEQEAMITVFGLGFVNMSNSHPSGSEQNDTFTWYVENLGDGWFINPLERQTERDAFCIASPS